MLSYVFRTCGRRRRRLSKRKKSIFLFRHLDKNLIRNVFSLLQKIYNFYFFLSLASFSSFSCCSLLPVCRRNVIRRLGLAALQHPRERCSPNGLMGKMMMMMLMGFAVEFNLAKWVANVAGLILNLNEWVSWGLEANLYKFIGSTRECERVRSIGFIDHISSLNIPTTHPTGRRL